MGSRQMLGSDGAGVSRGDLAMTNDARIETPVNFTSI